MSRRGRHPARRTDRGERDRGRRRARGDARGALRGQAGGAREQGSVGDGGRPRHPGGARGGRGDRPRRLRAQRRAPVRHRPAPHGAGAAHPHGVGRPVSYLDAGARGRCHGRRGAPPSHLENGEEDHRGFRHTREQGARSDRSALPVRPRVRRRGRGGAPAVGGARFRGVCGRLGAGAAGLSQYGAADSLRPHPPRAGPRRGHPAVRPRGRRQSHLRGGAGRPVPGVRAGSRGRRRGRHGARRVQRRERSRGGAVSRREDPVRPDRGDDRPGARRPPGDRCRIARGGAGRGRRGAPPGRGGRVLLKILAPIVVLGVLILVHEAGHFVAAKAVGIQVLRFALGFGQPIAHWRLGETEYWIGWIPFGGYVKMAGLEDEGVAGGIEGGKASVPVDPQRAFDRQPVWKRTIVILAGVTMNVVFAYLVYAGIVATAGAPELASTQIDSVITRTLPPGTEALASLKFGDRILRVNGDTVRSWDAILDHVLASPAASSSPSPSTELRFDVAGRAEPLVVRLPDSGPATRRAVAQALVRLDPPRLGLLQPGRPALRAGLQPGDLLLRANGDTLRSWSDVLHAVWHSPGKPLHLVVLRAGTRVQVTVVPDTGSEVDTTSLRPRRYGVIGAGPDPATIYVPQPLGRALVVGFGETWGRGLIVLGFLKGLVLHQLSVREVGGIITVGQISGQVAQLGLVSFLTFMAFFSINLAILNLLPIPILDGGQFMFLVAEAVRRRPLSIELRTRLTQVGFVVLLAIMILALTNDALRVLPR